MIHLAKFGPTSRRWRGARRRRVLFPAHLNLGDLREFSSSQRQVLKSESLVNYRHLLVREVSASSFIARRPFPLQVFGLTQAPLAGTGFPPPIVNSLGLEYLLTSSPSWTMAKSFSPKSTPRVLPPLSWFSEFSFSHKIEAKYLSDGVLLSVTVLIIPTTSWWNTALISPILGTIKQSPLIATFV